MLKVIFHYFLTIFFKKMIRPTINTIVVNQPKKSRNHPTDRNMVPLQAFKLGV